MDESNQSSKRPPVVAATAKAIEALPAADTEAGYYKHYSSGLAVRVMPARQGKPAVKTLCLYYQDQTGQRRPHKLGRYRRTTDPQRPGYMTLAEASEEINRLLRDMSNGIYPTRVTAAGSDAPEVAVATAAKFSTMTVDQLVKAYLGFTGNTQYRAPKTHTENQLQLAILTDALGSRPAISITPDDAATLALKVALRDRPLKKASTTAKTSNGMARAFVGAARKAFNWQLARENEAYVNPFAFIVKRPEITAIMSSTAHEPHLLNDVEIAHVWRLLADVNGPGSASVARALLLTLVTGQRPGEVASMDSREIHPANYVSLHTGAAAVSGKWWRIPWQKRKMRRKKERVNKQDLLVYLPPLALKIIGDYVGPIFPSPNPNLTHKPITEDSMSRLINKKLSGDGQWLGLSSEWRPNDLRKTARSKLSALKCPWDIGERIIGHQVGELDTVYNLYNYAEEKAKWSTAWADHIGVILKNADSAAPTDVRLNDDYDVDELRRLVSRMSLTAAGKHLGISGNAVKKRCQKHGIEWPDQGHWIKTEHRGYKNAV